MVACYQTHWFALTHNKFCNKLNLQRLGSSKQIGTSSIFGVFYANVDGTGSIFEVLMPTWMEPTTLQPIWNSHVDVELSQNDPVATNLNLQQLRANL